MTYLDTNIILYVITQDPKYGPACARVLADVETGKLQVGASTLVLLEVVGALRKLNATLHRKKRTPIDLKANLAAIISLPIVWFDLTAYTIERILEYPFNMQTADFVHLATAEQQGIREILSADKDFDAPGFIKRLDPLDY